MPETDYSRVVSEIKTWNPNDQLRLLEQMEAIIRKKTNIGRIRSILELQGRGKNIWKGLDVGIYLDGERSSFSYGVPITRRVIFEDKLWISTN